MENPASWNEFVRMANYVANEYKDAEAEMHQSEDEIPALLFASPGQYLYNRLKEAGFKIIYKDQEL